MTSTAVSSLPTTPRRPAHDLAATGRRDRWGRAPVPLCEEALPRLAGRLDTPRYDRGRLTTGVVHLGVGNFHRAHQAVYFDELAARGSLGWGIGGIGTRSRRVAELLGAQDLLYTVAELSSAAPRLRVIGALHRYLYAPDRPQEAVALLAAPTTQLVTLTLTGDGYPSGPATLVDPRRPPGAFDYLVQALAVRRRAGRPGLTVLSCDNRPDSAAASRECVLALAGARSPTLCRWVEHHVTFPDSMVDRITPATADGHRELVLGATGVVDRWPVPTETFSQWVVQDAFATDRPPLDDVGVQFVPDVRPWKLVKTRLLNGSHCALGYLGLLGGHDDTAAALGDPAIRAYLAALMERETGPLLPAVPGLDRSAYSQTLLTRFANPALADPLTRLAARASTKIPGYLLPSLLQAVRGDRPYELLTLALAAWIRCLQGAAVVGGRRVRLEDARGDELRALALAGGSDPRPLLATRLLAPLCEYPRFVGTLHRLLRALTEHGLPDTLDAVLGGSSAVARRAAWVGWKEPHGGVRDR